MSPPDEKPPPPTLRISTALDPPTLSLSQQQPYPPIYLDVTLTLHHAAQPVTLSNLRGSICRGTNYTRGRAAPPFRLRSVRTGERPDCSNAPVLVATSGGGGGGGGGGAASSSATAAKGRSSSSSSSSRKQPKPPTTTILGPTFGGLITVYPGEPLRKRFAISAYDDDGGNAAAPAFAAAAAAAGRVRPSPTRRLWLQGGWRVCGSALRDLRVDEEYEVEVAWPLANNAGYLFEWWEWGSEAEVVRRHVGWLGRRAGWYRFKVRPRWVGGRGEGEEEEGEVLAWEEGERGRIRFVE